MIPAYLVVVLLCVVGILFFCGINLVLYIVAVAFHIPLSFIDITVLNFGLTVLTYLLSFAMNKWRRRKNA